MYSDGVGGGYTKEQIEEKLQEVSKQFDSLPADYSDMDSIDRMIKDMEILENMTKGELKEEDEERAYQLLNNVEPQSIAQNQVEGGMLFQEASSAGVETSEDVSDAKKEWEEKGTDSKYFKNWFSGSKVVDEDGKPLVVYHGSLWNFDTFGKSDEFDFSFSPKFAYEYAAQKSFEQGLDLSPVLYSVYLKAENPPDGICSRKERMPAYGVS